MIVIEKKRKNRVYLTFDEAKIVFQDTIYPNHYACDRYVTGKNKDVVVWVHVKTKVCLNVSFPNCAKRLDELYYKHNLNNR